MNTVFSNAQWIFAAEPGQRIRDQYFEYQSDFFQENSEKTMLYLSTYSQYAVYVNEEFVDCGQMPGYEDLQYYDQLDLSVFLKNGKNTLLIRQYVSGENFSTEHRQIPGVIFSVWNGEREVLASAPGIQSRRCSNYLENGEKISGQLGFNFEYDANQLELPFSPSVLAGKEKHLLPRPIQKLTVEPPAAVKLVAQGLFLEDNHGQPKAVRMQTAWLSACRKEVLCTAQTWKIPEQRQADGIYLIADLGGETAGLLTLSLEVPRETEILIGFGEHLEDLRVRSFVGGRNFCLRYVAKPGQNTFFHPFLRLGLRYLQLHIYGSEITLHRATVCPTAYPLQELPCPEMDGLYQQIYETGRKTLRLCMHEHYEDCPWREQSLYAMDSRIQMLCGYYAFEEYRFPRASLELMAHSLRRDGLLELCAPGKVPVNIPSFTAVYLRQVWEYTSFSGDCSLAEAVFDQMKAIADGFGARVDDTGLIPLYEGGEYWNFYEWVPGLDGSEHPAEPVYESPLNAFVSDGLWCFSQLCRMLRPELEAQYLEMRNKLNQQLHSQFFHRETGAYLTRLGDSKPRHALTQAVLLFAGAVPENQVETVSQRMIHGSLLPVSVSMTIYVFEALLKQGAQYREYVLGEIRHIWGQMLAAGADTFWETQTGAEDFAQAGSLCHGWSSVPVYIMRHYRL